MILGILKEKNDSRVAMTPEVCQLLISTLNILIYSETKAGQEAYYSNQDYIEASVKIFPREELLSTVDMLVSIHPIEKQDLTLLKENAVYISLFAPFQNSSIINALSIKKLTTFSLDMIPRTTRAQAMDVLSSMASIAGYKAVIKAADMLPRYFPMLTTSAGAIPPAKVLIIGAGVAGLQAIATAKRNGGVVEVFDTRLASKEEVESLGAKFVMVEGAKDDAKAGGYAVEQSKDYKEKQKKLLKEKAIRADVIITSAQLRGKPAPRIITKDIVLAMQPGAVIIDLASSTGGNCELTIDNQVVIHNQVKILGSSTLMSEMPMNASKLFAKNLFNFLQLIIKNGALTLSLEDDILNASCLTFMGKPHQHEV